MLIKASGGTADMVVAIWPKNPLADDPAAGIMTFTRVRGDLKATGVPPGEYYVAAWEGIDPAITYDPDFLALFARRAVSVKVGENAKLMVDVTPIPKDKIAAEVAKLP
jgi:hypothetical protein